ncbi:MAG: zinc ribbon domain-containing protein [Actinomycetota bacterium]
MAFCSNCGQDIGDARFCRHCGRPVAGALEPGAPQAPPSPPPAAPPPAPGMQMPPQAFPPPPGMPPPPFQQPVPPYMAPGMRAPAARKEPVGPAARIAAVIGIVGAAMAVVGSFTPWVRMGDSMFVYRIGGLTGDGKITIILAIIALILFILALIRAPRGMFIAGLVLIAVAAAVFIYHFIDVARADLGFVGIGLYLGVIGCAVAVVGAILGIAARRI